MGPKIGCFPWTFIIALTTVLRTIVLHCDIVENDREGNKDHASRSFCVYAPSLWSSLPHSVLFCESVTTFRKHLKHLISNRHSLTPPSDPLPQRLGFSV